MGLRLCCRLVFSGFFLLSVGVVNADVSRQVQGVWADNKYMHLDVSINDNQLFGKIVKLFPDKKGNVVKQCKRGTCKGENLLGLSVFKQYVYNQKKKRWEGRFLAAGWNGKWYRTYVWGSSDGLLLYTKTYVGIFSRTQKWFKVSAE